MADAQATPQAKKVTVKLTGAALLAKRALRKGLKTKGRAKRIAKLATQPEFAKTYFEGRKKRAADKKTAFRKKKTRKK